VELSELLRRMPKAELHCHFVGAMRATTAVDIAEQQGITLPRPAETLYEFHDFASFISTYRQIGSLLTRREHFARVAYEVMEDGLEDANVVHRELHVEISNYFSRGIPLADVFDGLTEGLRAARAELGTTARIIVAIDRGEASPEQAVEIVRQVIDYGDELICGIGLSGPEGDGAPELFAEAFQLAAANGIRRTNHVCEDNQPVEKAPPRNYQTSRDLLLCERYDHGNNLVHDPAVLAEAAADGASFATVTFTSAQSRNAKRWASIKTMVDAGIRITINSDDPTFFGVTVADCYSTLFDELGWGVDRALEVCLESFRASWLGDAEREDAMRRCTEAFHALEAELRA
jgi:adenosine deaminase